MKKKSLFKKPFKKNTLLYKCYHSDDFLFKVINYSIYTENMDREPTDDELIEKGIFKNKRAIRRFEKIILNLDELKGV